MDYPNFKNTVFSPKVRVVTATQPSISFPIPSCVFCWTRLGKIDVIGGYLWFVRPNNATVENRQLISCIPYLCALSRSFTKQNVLENVDHYMLMSAREEFFYAFLRFPGVWAVYQLLKGNKETNLKKCENFVKNYLEIMLSFESLIKLCYLVFCFYRFSYASFCEGGTKHIINVTNVKSKESHLSWLGWHILIKDFWSSFCF